MIVIQGFLGGLLLLAVFLAEENLHLGDSAAIFFCSPVNTYLNKTLAEPFYSVKYELSNIQLSIVYNIYFNKNANIVDCLKTSGNS